MPCAVLTAAESGVQASCGAYAMREISVTSKADIHCWGWNPRVQPCMAETRFISNIAPSVHIRLFLTYCGHQH